MNASARGKGLFSSQLMERIRSRFLYVDWDPYSGRRTYLEAASGSLRPQAVIEAMAKETCLPDQQGRANPGSDHSVAVTAKGIEDLMVFFGANSGHIVPGWSSSHVLYRITNAVLSSVPGTNVVTTGLDHASVRSAVSQFARQYGKEERIAEVDPKTGSVSSEAILKHVDRHTCFLAIIHTSNVTGEIFDVGAIVREARKLNPDLFVMVDGVQYAPSDLIDVEEIGADAYVFAPYKAYGVKGCGYAHVSNRVATLPHWKYTYKPEISWDLGGVEHQSYAAWSAVVDYLCWLGGHFTGSDDRRELVVAAMKAIKEHSTALLSRLINGSDQSDGLKAMKHVTVYGMEADLSHRVCLVGFNLKGLDPARGCALYREKQLRLHAPGRDPFFAAMLKQLEIQEFIRLSACHYNTLEEIDSFLKATASLA